MTDFPGAFEDRMKGQLPDFDAFSGAHRTDPPVAIRWNLVKAEVPTSHRVPWTSTGQYLPVRPQFTLDPVFHGGAYYVQEPSSMFLEQAMLQSANINDPIKVLDLCAAPGGKSTHLLSLLGKDSLLVANEVIRTRATILSENLQKWGNTNFVVTNNDPKDFQRLAGYFDVIVVDAPCSGEGLFRKDPDAMEEWSVDNANLCAARQARILDDVWPALKTGGILIYCTCTWNEAENEGSIGKFAERTMSEPVDLQIDPSWSIERIVREHCIGYHFYPQRTEGEGFFLSVIRKTTEEMPARIRSKPIMSLVTPKIAERLTSWVGDPDLYEFIQQEDLIIMIPSAFRTDIEYMIKELRVLVKGTAVATVKHAKLIPEHALALSSDLNNASFDILTLNKTDALTYLRKETLNISDARKGYALVEFESVPLGWVNLLGNRANNLYPSSWRIRMGS